MSRERRVPRANERAEGSRKTNLGFNALHDGLFERQGHSVNNWYFTSDEMKRIAREQARKEAEHGEGGQKTRWGREGSNRIAFTPTSRYYILYYLPTISHTLPEKATRHSGDESEFCPPVVRVLQAKKIGKRWSLRPMLRLK